MLGCRSPAAARASRRKRSRSASLPNSPRRGSLIATTAPQLRVPRLVHGAEPALPDRLPDLEPPQALARRTVATLRAGIGGRGARLAGLPGRVLSGTIDRLFRHRAVIQGGPRTGCLLARAQDGIHFEQGANFAATSGKRRQ